MKNLFISAQLFRFLGAGFLLASCGSPPGRKMKITSAKTYLSVFFLLITLSVQSKAQVYDYDAIQGAGDYYSYAQFRIYVPDTVSNISGIYCYVHGSLGDTRSIVDDAAFRELCEEEGFALLGVHLDWGSLSYLNQGIGLHKSVLRGLRFFATESGHPEIEFAPIFLDGHSWGGWFSYFFTMWKPGIVIGFVAQKFQPDTIDVGAAIKVPGYLIYGEFDVWDMTPAFMVHRPRGALWALAIDRGIAHERVTDRDLLDNYFRDVIELRVPTTAIPSQPVILNTIDESAGWLGNRSTFEIAAYDSFAGDRRQASWLPSEDAAQRWQSFVSGGSVNIIYEFNPTSIEEVGLVPQQSGSHQDYLNLPNSMATIVGVSNVQYDPDIRLSEADASFMGEAASDNSGYSIASAGDVNGDGFEDFLIGARGKDGGGFSKTNAGLTYLVLGRTTADWGMDFDLSHSDASFFGEAGLDLSGFSIASAGDVNGDGLSDFLIAAPFHDGVDLDAGQTYLILGKAAADWGMNLDLSHSDASFRGEAASDVSGFSVATAGDVNGDGLSDFLIAAPFHDGVDLDAGETYLVLGRAVADWGMNFDLSQADASFGGAGSWDESGFSVATAGDVNGDGLSDFLIGTPFSEGSRDPCGQTYLILGRAAADWGMNFDLSQADASFAGEEAGENSGYVVASAGDVDGDGLDDFLIGAPNHSEGGYSVGQAYLLLGRAAADWGLNFSLSQSDASFIGEEAFDVAGFSAASAGDVNGDGLDDILIGAPNNAEGGGFAAGQTYLVLGRAAADWGMDFSVSQSDVSFIGEAVQDMSAISVAKAGDVNGDGLDDFLVGAWGNDEGGSAAGQTYLVLGAEVTGVAGERPIPAGFHLSQNYPNPFNPSTTIRYEMPERARVCLTIYDVLGREVAVLVDDEKEAGWYKIDWQPSGLSSGMYLYRLQTGEFTETKKVLLLR